jgi:hypothetical protein
LKDINGDGVADQSQLVVDDFNDEVTDVAGGVLSEGDDLFIAVGPDLWRMKDKNGMELPMKKLLSPMVMVFILDLVDMECRVLKWDPMEESIGKLEILVLMEQVLMDKNGNIPIAE